MVPKWIMIIAILGLTGCAEQRLEKLGLTDTAAFDYKTSRDHRSSGKELMVANVLPKASSSTVPQSIVLKAAASSPKEARDEFARKSSQEMVSGQLRNLLIGINVAKDGIWKLLDSYLRDYAVGERMHIVIVKGNAVEMVSRSYPKHPPIGAYIEKLLTQAFNAHKVPEANLYTFARDYYDDGIAPVAPILKQNKDGVEIDGIALFDKDKYVDQINADQAVPFYILYDSFRKADYNVHFKESATGKQQNAMLTAINSRRKVSVTNRKGSGDVPEVHFKISLNGTVLEYSGNADLRKIEEQKRVEDDLVAALTEELTSIVRYLQKRGTDSLGIGTYVRNSMSYADWKRTDWKKMYPAVKVTVQVKLNVTDYGMIR